MKVKFWGMRGSIPTPISPADIEDKIRRALRGAAGVDLSSEQAVERYIQRLPEEMCHTIGGNTACVEVRAGDQWLILDAGSGLRLLGQELMNTEFALGGGAADFLISHTHWDHIHGLPFFTPAFIAGNRLTFHSPHAHLEKAFTGQQDQIYFPVPLSYLSAELQFHQIPTQTWTQIGHVRVYPLKMTHPGESYGYRIEHEGKSLVYATDAEYKQLDPESTKIYVNFFRDADVLIFDAQYSFNDALDRRDWGHSSPVMGAEMAHRAGVRHLVLFHHDPTSSDQTIYAGLRQAEAWLAKRSSSCRVVIANEGLEIEC
jgi:phosphoribosyl 1,2-cyclic phosphodiesterase